MPQALQQIVDRLPEILQKNAPMMMRRMTARMKADIDGQLSSGNLSHGALFLKVSEDDLVNEFDKAIREAMVAIKSRAGGQRDFLQSMALSLEPMGEPDAPVQDAFATSSAMFATLCANAKGLGVTGVERYTKAVFESALTEAFKQSRMDARAMTELFPYGKSALNAELLALYSKLNSTPG